MWITIKGTDLSKDNPVAYRVSQETGIPEYAIEFYRGYIRFVDKHRSGMCAILGHVFNTECLRQLYDDLVSGKSPKAGCRFEIPSIYIRDVRWHLGEKDDYYGFDVDYGEL